jgi:uncharacterized protein (DUF2147 family)
MGAAMALRRPVLALALGLLAAPAAAEGPAGLWRVKDGTAHMRLAICEGRLWGVVDWAVRQGTDTENPDPAKRSRPIIGLPIILGMRPAGPELWEGEIYNAKNGKTYQASVAVKGRDRVEVEGCVLGGWLCSGETWTRLPSPTTGSDGEEELCSAITGVPRRAQKGRLK